MATENRHKFLEARTTLYDFGIRLRQLRVAKPEIQSGDLEEVATFALKEISKSHRRPLLVEDSGLFIARLKGFPGPFSAYVHRTIGTEGVLRLMKGQQKRRAYFQASIAFSSERTPPIVFSARVYGTIAERESGKTGFGFDPIFVPSGTKRTFADMGQGLKNVYSHRARTFRKFAEWYRARRSST